MIFFKFNIFEIQKNLKKNIFQFKIKPKLQKNDEHHIKCKNKKKNFIKLTKEINEIRTKVIF